MEPKETGVYYSDVAYLKFSERIKILILDCILLFFVHIGMLYGLSYISETIDQLYANSNYFMPIVVLLYLAFIKRTNFGGLGYWAVGAKLVDINGNRPSILKSLLRSLFFVFGPINLLIDYLWLRDDPNRQTIRDKTFGTYVVRKDASPIGKGTIHYSKYFMFGLFFMFPEVKRSGAI